MHAGVRLAVWPPAFVCSQHYISNKTCCGLTPTQGNNTFNRKIVTVETQGLVWPSLVNTAFDYEYYIYSTKMSMLSIQIRDSCVIPEIQPALYSLVHLHTILRDETLLRERTAKVSLQ